MAPILHNIQQSRGRPPYDFFASAGSAKHIPDVVFRLLDKNGFFDVKSADCTLQNPIHSIFARSQFEEVDAVLYKKMEPSLQLASRFIKDDRLLTWFYEQTVGVNKYFKQGEEIEAYLETPFSVQLPKERHKVSELWNKKLEDMATSGGLTFQFFKMGSWGMTFECPLRFELWTKKRAFDKRLQVLVEGKWHPVELGPDQKDKPRILVSDKFKTFFDSVPDTGLEALSVHLKLEYLCLSALFATTLVHEFAHAMGMFRAARVWEPSSTVGGYYKEPFHSKEEVSAPWFQKISRGKSESGWSWERQTFEWPIDLDRRLLALLAQAPEDLYPRNFKLGSPWLTLFTWEPCKDEAKFNSKGIPNVAFEGVEGWMMCPPEYLAKWFREEHYHNSQSKADMLEKPEKTFFLSSSTKKQRNGNAEQPDTWDPNQLITVQLKVFQTSDLL